MNPRSVHEDCRRAMCVWVVATTLAAFAVPVHAQTVDPNLHVASGTVFSSAVSGNTLYIGGQFSRVGPASGAAVPVDATTGAPIAGFPRVAGTINAIAPDGSGGWYIGGAFSTFGGVARNNAVHVLSDYSVDPAWNPGPNAAVSVITVSGSTVYLGGTFTAVGLQPRNRIAAVNATTGAPSAWDPNASGSVTNIRAIVVSGSTVYVGGVFTTIGGQPRNHLAALDATTGAATTWDAGLVGSSVRAIVVSGSLVYVGGQFTVIGGQPRNRIAALDLTTALATSWNPDANSNVLALAVDGSTVYAGGQFAAIGGQTRIRLAALDATTGLATAWNPNITPLLGVNSLAVAGGQVFFGGTISAVDGLDRSNAAAIDVSTGLATAWNPAPCGTVNAVAVSGSAVYLGGAFVCINSVPRLNLAAIDLSTGAATSWNPGTNGSVLSIAVGGDGTVYAGGIFGFAGGQSRNRLAALDPSSGLATAWNPGADGQVNTLVADGSTLYAGGTFLNVGGQPRSRIAAIDLASGLVTPWNPGADNTVSALALGGGTLYAGGIFSNIGGQPRQRIAAIDATSGFATAWNPGADDVVSALALGGTTLYAGGNFFNIGGQGRQRIAAIDLTSGSATGWNPGADNQVLALAVDGPVVYMGGAFTNVLGPRNRAAAVLAGSGHPAPWNPDMNSQVLTLALAPNRVIAGGTFSTVGGNVRSAVASISPQSAHAIVATAGANGSIQPAGVVGVFDGAAQSFTITPDPGYMISELLVDGSPVPPVPFYQFNDVTTSHTIAASFGPNVRTLTTSVSPAGSGTIQRSPDQPSYAVGSSVDLTAVPATNYAFVEWSGDLSGNANPASVLMDADRSVVAHFVYTGPPVSLQQGPGGTDETSEILSESWISTEGAPSPGTAASLSGSHLLLSEFSVAPSGQEWVEVHNPTAVPLDLSNFYLTNAFASGPAAATRSYEVLPSGNFVPAAGTFLVRFPAGASIPAGGTLVVALTGTAVDGAHGAGVTNYEILPSSPAIPDMVYLGGSAPAPGTGLLDDSVGFLMLLYWDGATDTVCDVDYVTWDTDLSIGRVNKTNRAVDGPDADLLATRYRPDTPIETQSPIEPPAPGSSYARQDGAEGGEIQVGSNGCVDCAASPSLLVTSLPLAGGATTVSPNQTLFSPGQSAEVTATPSAFYSFAGWAGDASGSQNPLTVTMDDCKSIIAIFQIYTYALNVAVVGGGSVAKSPDQAAYNHGTSVQLTATALPGYTFTGWSGDATGTANPLTVVMNGPKNITATFTLNTYALTTAVSGSGTLVRNPDQSLYDHGTTVELTATAGANHTFTSWSGDTTGATNPLTVPMNRAKSITAVFTIDSYPLDVTIVGAGAVARNPNQATYPHGSTVELTATANTGYTFTGWSGDASGTAPTVSVTMDGARQVTATFTINTFTVSASAGSGGSVARDPDQTLYDYGSVVEITATPDPGFVFAGWEGDATGFTNPLPVTVDGPKSISAAFLDAASNLVVVGPFTINSPATYDQVIVAGLLTVNAPLNVNGNMTVRPGGRVTHARGVLTGVQLNVGGRFWLQASAGIDVSEMGLLGGSRSGSPCHPSIGQTYNGSGLVTCSGGSAGSGGGSYGGIGGIGGTGDAAGSPGASYGVAEDPSQLGGGGGAIGVYVDQFHAGGNGGGLVRIVADSVIVDGEILADGQSVGPAPPFCGFAYNQMGAGGGGGIKIVASVFTGGAAAVIRANGGVTNACQLGGAGGGGRIAIWADDQAGFLGSIEARGGHQDAGFKVGSPGTLYRSATDGGGASAELIVANGGRHSWAYTPLRTGRTELRALRVRNAALLDQGGTPGADLTIGEDVRVESNAIHRLLAGASLAIGAATPPDLTVAGGARFIAYEGSSLALDQATTTSSGELYTEIPLAFAQAGDLTIAGGIVTVRKAAVLTLPDLNPSNFSAGTLDIGADASLHVTGGAIRLAGTLVKSGRFGDGGVGTPDAITTVTVLPGGRMTHGLGVLAGLRLNARSIRVEAGGRIDVAAQGLLGGSRFASGCDHRTGQTYDALGNITCSGGSYASAGGSYGGPGGIGAAGGVPAAAYGSAADPAHLGSGGGAEGVYVDIFHAGGNGGGLVRIVADSVIVDGEISADGESVGPTSPFCGHAYNGQAGGSGGGIKIAGGLVCGSGSMHARGGGTAPCGIGGGGGGGRIAILYGALCFPAGNLSVAGGGGGPAGGAGTIHLQLNATAGIAGSGSLTCDSASQPAAGVTVNLLQGLTAIATTTTGADGSYGFSGLPLGTYTVSVVAPDGYATPIDTRLVTLDEGDETVAVEAFPFACTTGDIAGRVTGTCGEQTAGLHGITVDVFRDDGFGTDVLVAVTGTDADGYFQVDNLALGSYTVGIVTQLGYTGAFSQQQATLSSPDGIASLPAFALTCQPIAAQPRAMGYWKHQVNVYLTGKGHAEETLAQLLGYIDLMVVHFNQHVINPVVVYVPGASTTNDKLLQLQQLLTVNRGGTTLDRAKQHILALLLNVVSGKISQVEEISDDGVTVSQAITHSYDLIVDGDPSTDEVAMTICELINDGTRVPSGMIPAIVPAYTYDHRPDPQPRVPLALGLGPIAPNPATVAGTITIALPTDERATLEVVDLAGRMVHREEVGSRGAGFHTLRIADLKPMRPGIYLVRLTQAGGSLVRRLAIIR